MAIGAESNGVEFDGSFLLCFEGIKEEERGLRHFLFPRSFSLPLIEFCTDGCFGMERGVLGAVIRTEESNDMS